MVDSGSQVPLIRTIHNRLDLIVCDQTIQLSILVFWNWDWVPVRSSLEHQSIDYFWLHWLFDIRFSDGCNRTLPDHEGLVHRIFGYRIPPHEEDLRLWVGTRPGFTSFTLTCERWRRQRHIKEIYEKVRTTHPKDQWTDITSCSWSKVQSVLSTVYLFHLR